MDQLKKAHEMNYVPQNMIMILTGNLSEKTYEKVLKNFKTKTAEKAPSKKALPIETANPKPLVIEKKAGLSQTYLCAGVKTVCSKHKDATALDLISAILSGGASSRLFIELREKHAITYDVQSDHTIGVDWGYLNINCAVKSKNTTKAKDLIFKELFKLRTEKVPLDEVERAKNQILADILRALDNPTQLSDVLAYMEIQFKSEKSSQSTLPS